MRQSKWASSARSAALVTFLLAAAWPVPAVAQRPADGNSFPGIFTARISPPPFPDALLGDVRNVPEAPEPRPNFSHPQRRAWFWLGIAQHSAAFFDAYTTRRAMRNHRELDPLLRPFAHSAAIYPAMQIAPLGVDWLTARLAVSRHRWLRRLWWLPQAAATAGFIWSGAHNLRLPSSPSPAPR